MCPLFRFDKFPYSVLLRPRYLIKPRKFLRARSDAGGGRVFVGILNSAVHLASDAAEEDNGD